VRKIFNDCAGNRKFCERNGFNPNRGGYNGDIADRRFDLSVREHRDGAMVVSLAGVLVNQLVQRGARRHRVKQQNHPHQQDGQGRFAELNELTF